MDNRMIESVIRLQPVINELIEEAVKNPQPAKIIKDGDFGYFHRNPKKTRIFTQRDDRIVAWSIDEIARQGYYNHFGADVNKSPELYIIAGNIHSLQMEQAV